MGNILSEEDIKYRDKVFDFFNEKVFGYQKPKQMQKKTMLSVFGLTTGQTIINNSIEKYGEYTYKEVYFTCLYCTSMIQKALSAKKFDGEFQQATYVEAIIRNNLGMVSNKMREKESSDKKLETQETIPLDAESAEYQHKGKINKRFEEMW